MAKNQETVEVTKKVVFRRAKKVTAKIVKTADLKPGETIRGKYVGFSERPWLNKETGEEKTIPQYTFEDLETTERFVVMGDAGFKNAMISAAIEANDIIEVEKHPQVDLGGGKRVNQYDIFQLAAQ